MVLLPEGTNYQPRTRLVSGQNSLDQLGELTAELSKGPVLLVTDPGIRSAGHVDRAVASLEHHGISVSVFDRARENPTNREVDECVEFARAMKPKLIIGLGGGSSMDTAKGCNFVYSNGGSIKDYWGLGKATKEMLPLIAVPTTAGTGSECQSYALIADAQTHKKMACGDPKATPSISILDPILTLTQPKKVAAATGIDALSHSLESAVTTKRNKISSFYSREAFKRTINALPVVLESPNDFAAREQMQTGAACAGLAIENSMLGAAHALANPLTARLGVTHGFAVGMMLPSIIRYNREDDSAGRIYHELAVEAELVGPADNEERAISMLQERILKILEQADAPVRETRRRIDDNLIDQLANDAEKEWTGTFNPRTIKAKEFVQCYQETFR